MGIDVRVLGPFEVLVAGSPVPLGGPKQRALLCVLVLNANAYVSVDRLVDEIWADQPPRGPTRSIQVYVSALRAALGPCANLLSTHHQGYRLQLEPDQLDSSRFVRAAAEAKRLLAEGGNTAAATRAIEALGLWRGAALGDLADLPVVRTEVPRLDELRLEVVETRLEAELRLGRHRDVVTELEVLVATHPLRERLPGLLMRALHGCGRQGDALAVFRAARQRLVDELGLEPGRELRTVHEAVLRDDPSLSVEPAELRERRHLPAPATALVGRRRQVDEVTALLRGDGVRLATTTGPGGIGKTRLALQAAHELAADFTDGVFFVGLAELRDAALVLPTVAAALGVEEVDEPLLRTVSTRLHGRRLLLLLDNFEHVASAAALVGELLSAAPGLRVLATSRSRLHVYGEHEYPVDVLDVDAEAVPLFVARARAADPGFRPDAGRLTAVREVCVRLDCLPLAIELAAARTAELDPAAMLASLPARLDLAVDGPVDRPARQQTLREAIDWSHRLLSDTEQQLFARLSVFAGGCTEDAVREVCGLASVASLPSLVGYNLVVRSPAAGTDRFEMLETIRELAAERLDPDDGVAGAHARYFLTLAEAAAGGLRGTEQQQWADRLDADRDNLRAALRQLLADGEPALRLAAALGFYWYQSGSAGEGSAWLEQTLAAAPDADELLRGRALHGLGILAAERGEATRALAYCEASCALFRATGEQAWVARSLNSQAGILRDRGEPDRAEPLFRESAEIRRGLGDDRASIAIVLGNLAIVALDRHDLAGARAAAQECLDLSQGTNRWLYAWTLQLLADVSVEEGDVAQARDLLRQVVPLDRELGAYRLIECLDTCAGLATSVRRYDSAALLTGAADAALHELGARMVPADAAMRQRRIAAARSALGDGRFAALQADGGKLSLDQAFEHAFAEVIDPG